MSAPKSRPGGDMPVVSIQRREPPHGLRTCRSGKDLNAISLLISASDAKLNRATRSSLLRWLPTRGVLGRPFRRRAVQQVRVLAEIVIETYLFDDGSAQG